MSVQFLCLLNGSGLGGSRFFWIVVKLFPNIFGQLVKVELRNTCFRPHNNSVRIYLRDDGVLVSLPLFVLKSSASASDMDSTAKIAMVVFRGFMCVDSLVEDGFLNCINCNPVPRGTGNHSHEALLNSRLASADSGLQLDLEIALGGVSAKIQPLRLIQPCRR